MSQVGWEGPITREALAGRIHAKIKPQLLKQVDHKEIFNTIDEILTLDIQAGAIISERKKPTIRDEKDREASIQSFLNSIATVLLKYFPKNTIEAYRYFMNAYCARGYRLSETYRAVFKEALEHKRL